MTLDIPMSNSFYKQYLCREMARRCERNPRYSLRSFAQALKVSPGSLSQIIAGKRVPSAKVAQRLLSQLELSPTDRQRFLTSLTRTQQGRGLKRMNSLFKTASLPGGEVLSIAELGQEEFRVISDWYHYVILELTFIDGFRGDPVWIASRLGISPAEAKLALERLLSMGLLTMKSGKIKKSRDFVTTADKGSTGPAYRRRQRQILEKAIHSLENDPIEMRDMTTITMPVDPALLPEAKKMIAEFRRKLCRFLESGRNQEVYELGVSLFPVSISKKEGNKK